MPYEWVVAELMYSTRAQTWTFAALDIGFFGYCFLISILILKP